jgi:exonuclease III
MTLIDNTLAELNNCNDLDLQQSLINLFGNDNDNPYTLFNNDAKFYDPISFRSHFKNDTKPLYMNLNIQSLQSKHCELNMFMNELSSSKIFPDILCLQEIWQILDVNTVQLSGYDFVYKKRSKFRGGGVGCYIKKGIQYKIIERHSIFIEKIFECITLELTLNGEKIIVCNYYRPPTPHPNFTPNEQLDCFFENFSLLLNDLSSYNNDVYVFSDTNINLINVQQGSRGASLLKTALEHGFFQTNKKITRFGDHGSTLIDHVFTNSIGQGVRTGSIIVDISNHLITFIQPEGSRLKVSEEPTYRRSFNNTNLTNFRNDLSVLSWNNVMSCNNVDEA